MSNPEIIKDQNGQNWDMSDVTFSGAEEQNNKKLISEALKYSSGLLESRSAIFGGGRLNAFANATMFESNDNVLEQIRTLDNGRYEINYGTDDFGKGFTGLGQVSEALDYFDKKYGNDIDDARTKGFLKTCIAMWPMGNADSLGVHEFAKSAKIDDGTDRLVSMVIDRNSMKLVQARFEYGDDAAGQRLLKINQDYLLKIEEGPSSGYEEREATAVCNMQKIIMDCEKNGAKIAKERKLKNK